jgi:hypothetical protein
MRRAFSVPLLSEARSSQRAYRKMPEAAEEAGAKEDAFQRTEFEQRRALAEVNLQTLHGALGEGAAGGWEPLGLLARCTYLRQYLRANLAMLKEARRDPRDSPVAASTYFHQELTREFQHYNSAARQLVDAIAARGVCDAAARALLEVHYTAFVHAFESLLVLMDELDDNRNDAAQRRSVSQRAFAYLRRFITARRPVHTLGVVEPAVALLATDRQPI